MNETNRLVIVTVAALVIVLAAVVIFLAWTADKESVDALRDAVTFLDENRDNAGRLIVTLAALIVAVLALLAIIVELAPEDEEKELRIEQAGATTIVPAQALRARLEEMLLALPDVTAARARLGTRDKGVAAALDVTVTHGANVAQVTQEAVRVVVDTVQTDLGLPLSGLPPVRVHFGGAAPQPVASSTARPPVPEQGAEATPEPPSAPPPGSEPPPAAPPPGPAASWPPAAPPEAQGGPSEPAGHQ